MANRESEKKTHKARSRIVLCFLIPAVLLFVIYKAFPARQQNQRTQSPHPFCLKPATALVSARRAGIPRPREERRIATNFIREDLK